ncbi:hypothetical protein ABGB12_20110 [Actinocorallia sp. B10E7]|uniref:hypothetical protein n=1 Tax=Actinocorallia sp. B10E7 TaxID=3153558 RepID=UPI00325D46E5
MRWGRHRKTADAFTRASLTEARPRESQPRDQGGRFRAAGRDYSAFELDDSPEAPETIVRVPPHSPDHPWGGDGRLHCGPLEGILHRQWDLAEGTPPPEVVRAVESLAMLPERLKLKLAEGLDGIYIGPGGVPELDDMGHLKGRRLPSGRATWDICAGAYGNRKVVVGDRPSPTPDVMMHEIGHALDDVDDLRGGWVSDTPGFQSLYAACEPFLQSDFHRQRGQLGRREFFADAFAAIASHQRPALVDMLGGNIRLALDVMLFFNRRYGI